VRIRTETAVGFFILISVAVFFYMSYQVGSFRLDRIKYNTYSVYFNDISGLSKKSDVKIAGVKVGWVDAVDLINDGQQVKATVLIDKKYQLYSDAHAVVRQEGLLGSKYLELTPGDPLLSVLPTGSMLTRPSVGPIAVDELLRQFKDIAANVESITGSMRGAIGGPEGEEKLRSLVSNMQQAVEKFSSFAQTVDRITANNEGNIDSIMGDLRLVLQDLRNEIPRLSSNLQQNFEKISATLDRDFNRMATQLEAVGAPVRDVVVKINEGQGIIGQLINDEAAARDVRVAINSLKTYFDKVNKLAIVFDIHTEAMYSPYQDHCFRDSKGYFNIRIHPREDYFYLVGLVTAQSGRLQRYEEHREWFDGCDHEFVPADMHLKDKDKLWFAPITRQQVRVLDQYLYNIQFGKVFGSIAVRGGIFDSTGGVAVDIDLPLSNELFRWVTTFEMFDLKGRNRLCDGRPHFKWLNRMFFTRNIYFTFGADDFISRHNKSAFFGVGIRFADDDVKYLLSRLNVTV